MICTWKDCTAEATHPQLDREGGEWANLCQEHHNKLEDAIASADAKRLLGAWACAGKGHPARERLNRNIADGMAAIVKLTKNLGVRDDKRKRQEKKKRTEISKADQRQGSQKSKKGSV